jgi:hypothetical protein
MHIGDAVCVHVHCVVTQVHRRDSLFSAFRCNISEQKLIFVVSVRVLRSYIKMQRLKRAQL